MEDQVHQAAFRGDVLPVSIGLVDRDESVSLEEFSKGVEPAFRCNAESIQRLLQLPYDAWLLVVSDRWLDVEVLSWFQGV